MANYYRLQQAALISQDCHLTPEQNTAIESLTDAEVEALISARNKLSPVFQGKTGWTNKERTAEGGIRMHCLLDPNCSSTN